MKKLLENYCADQNFGVALGEKKLSKINETHRNHQGDDVMKNARIANEIINIGGAIQRIERAIGFQKILG